MGKTPRFLRYTFQKLNMCGRYTFTPTPQFYQRFDITNNLPELLSVPKATPGQFMPIVYKSEQKNIVDLMRWGLIPQWAKNLDFGSTLFNARSETVLEKPSFRGSFNSCRCLVPANSFFEKSHKYRLKSNQMFSLAGLYSIWESPDGSFLPTYTILTTSANYLIKPVHDRMPVVLHPQDESLWLNPIAPSTKLFTLLKPFPDQLMTIA